MWQRYTIWKRKSSLRDYGFPSLYEVLSAIGLRASGTGGGYGFHVGAEWPVRKQVVVFAVSKRIV